MSNWQMPVGVKLYYFKETSYVFSKSNGSMSALKGVNEPCTNYT